MSYDNWAKTIALILIAMVAIWYLGLTTYQIFNPGPEKTVKIEVVGFVKQINATTLTSLHYECIKMCNDEFYNSDSKLDACWKQCATLGKEQMKE